jgi:hypothetical protein
MQLTSDFKLAFVVILKKEADNKSQSFWDALVTITSARVQSVRGGRALISTSSNGKVVAYAMPATSGAITEDTITELCGELMRRYREAEARLIAEGTDSPADGDIYEEMEAYLVPITEYTMDFSNL